MRENSVPGEKCVGNQQLSDEGKIFFLLPLHSAVCLNFLGKVKAEKCEELVRGLVQGTPGCGVYYFIEDSFFFTFPLGLLSSETTRSERITWRKFPPEYFQH